jgi:hypothetical protein
VGTVCFEGGKRWEKFEANRGKNGGDQGMRHIFLNVASKK